MLKYVPKVSSVSYYNNNVTILNHLNNIDTELIIEPRHPAPLIEIIFFKIQTRKQSMHSIISEYNKIKNDLYSALQYGHILAETFNIFSMTLNHRDILM